MMRLRYARLLSIHLHILATVPPEIAKRLTNGDRPPSDLSTEEKTAYLGMETL